MEYIVSTGRRRSADARPSHHTGHPRPMVACLCPENSPRQGSRGFSKRPEAVIRPLPGISSPCIWAGSPARRYAPVVAGAYEEGFDHDDKAPVVRLTGGQHVLELWHGPTLAFKDMGLQMLRT